MVTSIFVVDMRCHAEQREASPRFLHAISAGCRLSASRRFFVTLRMTTQAIITNSLEWHIVNNASACGV